MFAYKIQKLRTILPAFIMVVGMTYGLSVQALAQDISLIPKHFALDNRFNGTEVIFVIDNQLYFSFDVPVAIKQGATASIVSEEETMATGLLKAYNIEYSGKEGGYVEAIFNSLSLPKGKDYTFVIGAGEIYRKDDPACTNDELRRSFHIPEHIRMIDSKPKDGETLSKLDRAYIKLSAIQDYAYSFKPQLYKENEIMTDKYFSYANFYEEDTISLKFYDAYSPETMPVLEEGVEYTIVVPEGSMKGSETCYRDDISNEEMRIHIKGGNSTGIHTTNASEKPSIHCDGKTLHIDNVQGQCVRIFSPDGRMIRNTVCQESNTCLDLPATGLYIVNIGGQSDKISVR